MPSSHCLLVLSIIELAPAGWGPPWTVAATEQVYVVRASVSSLVSHKVAPGANSVPPVTGQVSASQQPKSCAQYPPNPLASLLFLLLGSSSSHGITSTPAHLTTGKFSDVRGHPSCAPDFTDHRQALLPVCLLGVNWPHIQPVIPQRTLE